MIHRSEEEGAAVARVLRPPLPPVGGTPVVAGGGMVCAIPSASRRCGVVTLGFSRGSRTPGAANSGLMEEAAILLRRRWSARLVVLCGGSWDLSQVSGDGDLVRGVMVAGEN